MPFVVHHIPNLSEKLLAHRIGTLANDGTFKAKTEQTYVKCA